MLVILARRDIARFLPSCRWEKIPVLAGIWASGLQSLSIHSFHDLGNVASISYTSDSAKPGSGCIGQRILSRTKRYSVWRRAGCGAQVRWPFLHFSSDGVAAQEIEAWLRLLVEMVAGRASGNGLEAMTLQVSLRKPSLEWLGRRKIFGSDQMTPISSIARPAIGQGLFGRGFRCGPWAWSRGD